MDVERTSVRPADIRAGRSGWTRFLRDEGAGLLAWLREARVLETNFGALARATDTRLRQTITSSEEAMEVWSATSAILGQCNEQKTYSLPGAAAAYAWLHLMDRYARTWSALERMVDHCCLPMGQEGVRVLDVGTGPGPSAFAIHDFYSAFREYGTVTADRRWHQPPRVTCVEYDRGTNSFRHVLAQMLFVQTNEKSRAVLDMCSALEDFSTVKPRQERRELEKHLRNALDEYYDEVREEWTSDQIYTAEEANWRAQGLHRYRLIVFSNFLTEVGTVRRFEPNLVEVLDDARPGTVLLIIGGKGGEYPEIYGYVNDLCRPRGFRLEVQGIRVSTAGSPVSGAVFETGQRIFELLEALAPNGVNLNDSTRFVARKFRTDIPKWASSQIWVFRKP